MSRGVLQIPNLYCSCWTDPEVAKLWKPLAERAPLKVLLPAKPQWGWARGCIMRMNKNWKLN